MSSVAPTQEGEVVAAASYPTMSADAERGPMDLGPQSAGRFSDRMKHRLIGLASVIGVLVLWQVLADTHSINVALFSSPSDIWDAGKTMSSNGTLGPDVVTSAKLYGAGFAASVIIGVVFGVIFGWWRTLGAVFDPWIAILYSVPLVAVLPLILVWFGIGFKGQMVMVTLVSVFPLLVNVMVGTRQLDPGLLRLAKSFGASQGAILRTLVLPSIVPYIVTGVRLAAGGALIGVTLAEYFEGDNGIGGLIVKEGTILDTSGVFVGIVILAAASLTITAIIRTLERRVSRWREDA